MPALVRKLDSANYIKTPKNIMASTSHASGSNGFLPVATMQEGIVKKKHERRDFKVRRRYTRRDLYGRYINWRKRISYMKLRKRTQRRAEDMICGKSSAIKPLKILIVAKQEKISSVARKKTEEMNKGEIRKMENGKWKSWGFLATAHNDNATVVKTAVQKNQNGIYQRGTVGENNVRVFIGTVEAARMPLHEMTIANAGNQSQLHSHGQETGHEKVESPRIAIANVMAHITGENGPKRMHGHETAEYHAKGSIAKVTVLTAAEEHETRSGASTIHTMQNQGGISTVHVEEQHGMRTSSSRAGARERKPKAEEKIIPKARANAYKTHLESLTTAHLLRRSGIGASYRKAGNLPATHSALARSTPSRTIKSRRRNAKIMAMAQPPLE